MGGIVPSSLFRGRSDNKADIDDELVLTDATSLSILEKSLALLRSPFILNPTLSDNVLRVAKEVWVMIQKDESRKYKEARQGAEHSMSCLEWFVKKLNARVSELDSSAWDFFPEELSDQVALVCKMVDSIFSVLSKMRMEQGEAGVRAGWGCGCAGRNTVASVTPVLGGKYPPAGPTSTATRRKGDPLPPLYKFAKLHFCRGIETNHYIVMGLAMLSALKYCLGDELTEGRHHAWAVVYSTVLMSMLPYSMAMEVRYSFKGAGGATSAGTGAGTSVEFRTLSLSASASATRGVPSRPSRSHSDPTAGRLLASSSSESANVYVAAEKLENLRCLNENSVNSANSRSQRSLHSSMSAHGEAGNPAGLLMMAKLVSGGDTSGLEGVLGGEDWSCSSRQRPAGSHTPQSFGGEDSKEREGVPSSMSKSRQPSSGVVHPSTGTLSASMSQQQPSQQRRGSSSAIQQMVLADMVAEAAAIDAVATGENEATVDAENCAVTSYFMNLGPSARSSGAPMSNYREMGDMTGKDSDYDVPEPNSLMM